MGNTTIQERVQAHTRAIQACNQRGGRMLSLVDLLEDDSVNLEMAGYLAAAMRAGASLLVGAQPGGAGKTTVMCALLNFLPDETRIRSVDTPDVMVTGARESEPGEVCFIAHEISPATYYRAYLWGSDARAFFRLRERDHLIATNLHADTLAQTREQLCGENGVAPEHLAQVNLKLYLRMRRSRGWQRAHWIHRVYESDGADDRLLWESDGPGAFERREASDLVTSAEVRRYQELIASLRDRGVRTIEEVRRAIINE